MAAITLYSAKTCPFAQRARLTLLEKGLDHNLIELDIKDIPGWFHDLSPYGKVPVVQDGDELVWESAIINEYLEECYPEPALLPASPGLRAYARFWIDFANTSFVPRFYKLLLEQHPQKQAQRAEELHEHLGFMERHGLSDRRAGSYWLNDHVSLVDLTFYPFFERLPVLEHYRGFKLSPDCPRLADWWERMRERETVQELMNGDDFYIRAYASYADGSAAGATAQTMREA